MDIAQLIAQAKGARGPQTALEMPQMGPQAMMQGPGREQMGPAEEPPQMGGQEMAQEPVNMDEYVPEIGQLLEAGYHPMAIARMIHEASEDGEHPFRDALRALRQLQEMGGEFGDGDQPE